MSFWLNNGKTTLDVNNYWFREILTLAKKYGWKPMGTEGPVYYKEDGSIWRDGRKGWKGYYFSNDFQTVTEKDAKNIAKALKKAKEFGEGKDWPVLEDFIKLCKQGRPFTLG